MLIYLEDNYTKRIRSNRSHKSNRLVSLPDLMFPNIRIKPLKVLKCLINNKKKMVYCTLLTLFTAFFNYYFIVYFIYLNPVQIFSVKKNLIEMITEKITNTIRSKNEKDKAKISFFISNLLSSSNNELGNFIDNFMKIMDNVIIYSE